MTIFWGVIIGFVVAVLAKTATDLSSEEMRARFERLPLTILNAAAGALPDDEKEDLRAEWAAELAFVLRGSDGLPLTRQWRGLRFAVSLALAGPALGCERSARAESRPSVPVHP